MTTFVGPVFVKPLDGRDVTGLSVAARTSSPGGGGRFGLFYPALPDVRSAAPQAWLFGLRQDGDTRTNLALVNLGDRDGSDARFAVEIFDGSTGALLRRRRILLPPRRFLQSGILSSTAPRSRMPTQDHAKREHQLLSGLRHRQRRRHPRGADGRRRVSSRDDLLPAVPPANDDPDPGRRPGASSKPRATTSRRMAPASALSVSRCPRERRWASGATRARDVPCPTRAGPLRSSRCTAGTLGEVRSPSGTVRRTFPLSRASPPRPGRPSPSRSPRRGTVPCR